MDILTSKIIDSYGTRAALITACEELEAMCVSCTGPFGRFKILQVGSNSGAVIVTSSSNRLFETASFGLNSPAMQALVDLVRTQGKTLNDGGLMGMGLACRLVQTSLRLDISRPVVLEAYATCLSWCLQYLGQDDCPVRLPIRLSNLTQMCCIGESVLGAKAAARLQGDACPMLVTLLLRSFLGSLHDEPALGGGTTLRPCVRYVSAEGYSPMASEALTNTVVIDVPLPPGAPRTLGPSTVLLFDVSLAAPRTSFALTATADPHTEGTSAADGGAWTAAGAELESLQRLGDAVANAGVRMVLCQRVIHPFLKTLLLRRGVLPLDRLSVRFIDAVQRVSGARVLSSWSADFDVTGAGSVAALRCTSLPHAAGGGGRSYVLLQAGDEQSDGVAVQQIASALTLARTRDDRGGAKGGAQTGRELWLKAVASRRRPLVTVVLCHDDRMALDELRSAAESVVAVYSRMLRLPVAVAGGGCTELHLAHYVRQRAEELRVADKGRRQNQNERGSNGGRLSASQPSLYGFVTAALNFAACLEGQCGALCSVSPRVSTRDVIAALSVANAATLKWRPQSELEQRAADGGVRDRPKRVQVYGWAADEERAVEVLRYSVTSFGVAGVGGGQREVAMEECRVLDPLAIKTGALRGAVEAAVALLRVEGTIVDTT